MSGRRHHLNALLGTLPEFGSFTLNLHHGTKFSVALPVDGAVLNSSNPKVVSVTANGNTVIVNALEKGESVLSATFLGQNLPVQVNVKVW